MSMKVHKYRSERMPRCVCVCVLPPCESCENTAVPRCHRFLYSGHCDRSDTRCLHRSIMQTEFFTDCIANR